ncbi:MAG TPA: zinc-dependent metalloprotease [Casimicrobiaceae bacterium]|nr:zinc-dependent metalloprotease [Casimicrobiaceae bacterium]
MARIHVVATPPRALHAALAMSFAAAFLVGCATAPTAEPDTPAIAAAAAAAATAATAATSAAPAQAAAPGSAAKPSAPVVAAAAAAATAAAAAAQTPKPFAEVIKDAHEMPGLFPVWQKDEKAWLEIAPNQFDVPYFFSVNLSRGLGEKFFFGGLMGPSHIVYFHHLGPHQVQLLARNTDYFAQPNTPQAISVSEAFSDSLLASAPIASQPHPERKTVLVEINSLLFADIPGANGELERTYRQGYAFDGRNSSINKVRATPELVAVDINAHYALQRVAQPPIVPGPVPFTSLPATVPDIRSLFLGFYYNFAKLPEEPMRPRFADDRIGYFMTTRYDYSNDSKLTPRVNYVNRWRLEKKDPTAALSEPKQPIVFWLDRNIPEKYRAAVIAGVLEWNKAFEKIGFKDAIQTRIQPDDADFDTLDARHASVRWITTARPLFGGIGPSQVDPRSGEILDADIGIDPVRFRNRRYQRVEQIPDPSKIPGFFEHPERLCQQQDYAAQEMNFALDLLEARGEIDPDGPEAEAFVMADVKDTVMHEVGHTLGLRHNFRASMIYSQAQLNDPQFTREHGIAGSVMEYNAVNIALKGEPQGTYGMATIGPYDYWAIEYGYSELPPEQESVKLQQIASRNAEPQLAFATDEDAAFGIDPEANTADLGNDPLDFARRRLILARELWDRWENRELKPGESYSVLRRTVTRGLLVVGQSSTTIAKYIGGVSTLRDHAGSARAPLTPLPAAKQRQALKIIESGLFAADSFRFKPEFMRRLQVDYLDHDDVFDVGLSTPGVDYSLDAQVLRIQRAVLGNLMSDTVAQRILDSEVKLDDPKAGFHLSELYDSLHRSIWSELRSGQDISPLRRNLQREHLARVANALIRPSVAMPPDARALLRQDARALRDELQVATTKNIWSKETKAHIAEGLSTLDEALKAPLQRQGV